MKTFLKYLFFFIIIASLDLTNLHAQFTYTDNGTDITITGYTGAGGSVVIPSTIIGKPVTTIGSGAFFNKISLTSVTIPSSVTSIGPYAFGGCTGLTSAHFLGNAPTLASNVFDNTAVGFTVYFHSNKTGFTTPTWNGYTAVDPGNVAATASLTYRLHQPTIISLDAVPPTGNPVYAIETAVPANMIVSAISHGGVFDTKTNKVKWGVFLDANPRQLTFTLQAPGGYYETIYLQPSANMGGVGLDFVDVPITLVESASFSDFQTQLLASNPNASTLPTADDDGDGVPLLLEYAFGLDPTKNSASSLPAPTTATVNSIEYLTLKFRKVQSNVVYAVETSNDLTSWTNLNAVLLQDGGTTGDTIVGVPMNTQAVFMRLKVSIP